VSQGLNSVVHKRRKALFYCLDGTFFSPASANLQMDLNLQAAVDNDRFPKRLRAFPQRSRARCENRT
jgi:hypothetical protein